MNGELLCSLAVRTVLGCQVATLGVRLELSVEQRCDDASLACPYYEDRICYIVLNMYMFSRMHCFSAMACQFAMEHT